MPDNVVKIGSKVNFSYKSGQTTFEAGFGYWDGTHIVTKSMLPASFLELVSTHLTNNVMKMDGIDHDSVEWSFQVKESQ